MIKNIQLDHIAIAVESWEEAWPTLLGQLYAKWRSGGTQIGFQPSQYAFENEMKIELIAPYLTEQNDFLRRFIDKSGTGPHHMTFKVKDISVALEVAQSLGFTVVSKNTENEWWKEAFLHPKETCGIVIQLAQAAGTWFAPPPENIFKVDSTAKSSLKYVCYVVKDFATANRVFLEFLGGTILYQGKVGKSDLEYMYLSWPGPGRVMLIYSANPSDETIQKYLGAKLGKVNYLYFEIENLDRQTSEPDDRLNKGDLYISESLISEIPELTPIKNLTVISENKRFNVQSVINYLS